MSLCGYDPTPGQGGPHLTRRKTFFFLMMMMMLFKGIDSDPKKYGFLSLCHKLWYISCDNDIRDTGGGAVLGGGHDPTGGTCRRDGI